MFKISSNLQSQIDSLKNNCQSNCQDYIPYVSSFNNGINALQKIEDTNLIQNFVNTANSIMRDCNIKSEDTENMEEIFGKVTAQWCRVLADFGDFVEIFADHESDKLIQQNNKLQESSRLVSILKQEKANLSTTVDKLTQEKNKFQTEKENLIKGKTELTNKVDDLTREKSQCEAQQQKLAQEKSSLSSQKEELSNQISKLAEQSKALCKELDATQFAMDETHHDCINLI